MTSQNDQIDRTNAFISFFNAEKAEDGKEGESLQWLESLRTHLKDEKHLPPSARVELYEAFQNEDQIKDRLDRIGYPSLLGCFSRLPRNPVIGERVRKTIVALEKEISDVFETSDIEFLWNSFSESFKEQSKIKKIYLYSIQLGNRSLWLKLLQNIFAKGVSLKNCFFVFYWLPPSNTSATDSPCNHKIEFEAKDKLWSYSRFLRDYLVSHEKAIEIPLVEAQTLVNCEPLNKFLQHPDADPSLHDHFYGVSKMVRSSLVAVYGPSFSWLEDLKEDNDESVQKYVTAMAQLYLHNRSVHTASDRKSWKALETYIVGREIPSSTGDHGVLGEMDKRLAKYRPAEEVLAQIKGRAKALTGDEKLVLSDEHYLWGVGENYFWSHFLKTMSSLTAAYIWWRSDINPSFICIDDKPDRIKSRLKELTNWFKNGKVGYVADNSDGKMKTWRSLFESEKVLETEGLTINNPENEEQYDSLAIENADFLLIDLEYDGEGRGFELLRKLRSETRSKLRPFVITLSRRDDPESIQRSLNSGALFHITKSHFFDIVPAVCQLWGHTKSLRDEDKDRYAEYENWHLLSKLPLRKTLELQSSRIEGLEYNPSDQMDRWSQSLRESKDYQWIRGLPKADIHCHIGSFMGADLLPQTALLVLAEFAQQFPDKLKQETLTAIIEFLLPIVSDPNLIEEGEYKPSGIVLVYLKEFESHKVSQISKNPSIFQVLEGTSLSASKVILEDVLLNPADTTIERLFELDLQTSRYLQNKIALRRERKGGVSYDLVMLVFVLLLHVRDMRDKDLGSLNGGLQEMLKDKEFGKFYMSAQHQISCIESFLSIWQSSFTKDQRQAMDAVPESKKSQKGVGKTHYPTLAFLQNAHHRNRCLNEKKASLSNYLRGCEYSGSAHLQSKAAILLATKYVIERAREDNIRYLCLRCAVDGYSKFGLQSQDEAMEALLTGLDHFKKSGREHASEIQVNVIVTAKKHKSEKELEDNIRLARKYRDGLRPKSDEDVGFFELGSRVVSFDLAGLEKGNRPSRFQTQLMPLLRECFPITIHAGEEDDHEAIWEAIYLLQSQRIGHALTLRNNKRLMEMVRERHIAIELCPLSNLLTSGLYESPDKVREIVRNDKRKEHELTPNGTRVKDANNDDPAFQYFVSRQPEFYPLREYLDENLDVTINTDNPVVSDSTITKEYLVAAHYAGGLTKWEILRLIKNSFRAAAIPKDEKRKLMNEIDDEIYEILLNEE